jgi:hypothetical protein
LEIIDRANPLLDAHLLAPGERWLAIKAVDEVLLRGDDEAAWEPSRAVLADIEHEIRHTPALTLEGLALEAEIVAPDLPLMLPAENVAEGLVATLARMCGGSRQLRRRYPLRYPERPLPSEGGAVSSGSNRCAARWNCGLRRREPASFTWEQLAGVRAMPHPVDWIHLSESASNR